MRQGHFQNQQIERLIWGVPAAEAIANEVSRLGAKRIFIVSSGSLSRKSDEVVKIRTALGDNAVGLFDTPREHTPMGDVIDCAIAARDANPDLLITIGGGTPIDLVKMVQLCLTHDVFTPDALLALPRHTLTPSRVRTLVVPTTLSGGEYASGGGMLDETRKAKLRFDGFDLCARTVILDPAVTVHTPEQLWLSTAIRAVDHAIEGYCARARNPVLETMSLEALRLLAPSLRRTKENPSDMDARLDSQIGVWHATIGFGGVASGASHGIGYVLGGAYHVPHGYTSCVMLPSVLRWNAKVNGERQKAIAAALGEPNLEAADAVSKLLSDLDLPQKLSDVGVKPEHFADIAARAVKEPMVQANPRDIKSANDVVEILELAA